MVERVEISGTVNSCRIQQLQRERGQHKLTHEEHALGCGNCGKDQRQEVVRHVDLVHELIKADGGDLRRDHHNAEDKGEERVAQSPVIGNEGIGRQRGEVDR